VWGHQLEEVNWISSDEAEGSAALDTTSVRRQKCWRWRRTSPACGSGAYTRASQSSSTGSAADTRTNQSSRTGPRIVPPPSWVSKAPSVVQLAPAQKKVSGAQLMRPQKKAAPMLRGSVALSVAGTVKDSPMSLHTTCAVPEQDKHIVAVNALQGLWANKEQSSEVYEVRGLEVSRTQEGGVPRTFQLHWNAERCRVEWGIGRYELIPPSMDAPLQEVAWQPLDGGRGFVWRRLHAHRPTAALPGALHQGVRVARMPRPPGLPPPMYLLDFLGRRQRRGPY